MSISNKKLNLLIIHQNSTFEVKYIEDESFRVRKSITIETKDERLRRRVRFFFFFFLKIYGPIKFGLLSSPK
jgi:hypothetical protein